MSKASNQQALDVLVSRCGEWSRVRLKDGKVYRVYDVAWRFDRADGVAILTTNTSPGPENEHHTVDSFRIDEVAVIEDARSGKPLFQLTEPEAPPAS